MDRFFRSLAILAIVPGCYHEPETEDTDLGDSDNGSGTGNGSAPGDGSGGDDDSGSDPTTPATTDPSDTTSGSAVCGDGMVEGDEVCDDGTNDGSYGGCLADCSGQAAHCGDGDVNGPEVCDDGTNDGSYGGCSTDCAALGPYCGDGTTQRPELCDEGEANENGSGCNVDCVTSGTVVGTYELDALDFCDGDFPTQPAFRDNGNALVAATGYCNDDSVVLVELSPDVELVQSFDDLVLPETPIRMGVLAGDDWILATSGCNYRITDAGELTEVCEPRTTGNMKLESASDGRYLALDYGQLALYPNGSPMLGDSPSWSAAPPSNATYNYYYYDTTFGTGGSAVVVGSRSIVGTPGSVGLLSQYSAGGNLAATYTFNAVEAYYAIARGPNNGMVMTSDYPDYVATRIDPTFNEQWSIALPAASTIWPAIDSTGAVVLAYRDTATSAGVLQKLTPDGQTTLWTLPLASDGYSLRMGIDASDAIWVVSIDYAGTYVLDVQKVSP